MSMGAVEVAGLEGGLVSLSADQLQALEQEVEGQILRRGQDGWDDSVSIWNAMVAAEPALVLRPATAADVSAAVRFASDNGLLMSVKGGGHNIAGTSIAARGFTLDMSLMRAVAVDPDARQVRVGPGCVLSEVDVATQAHGLAAVLGFVSETGVAGLTLGGGFGYLTRQFGWTVDNLDEVEIVTADGELRIANREENDALFWAVRGAGGNMGVVTRLTLRVHEVGPTITGGLVAWSAERAEAVLDTYREVTRSAPRELTAFVTIRQAPPAPFVPEEWHGRPIVALGVCHVGGADSAATDLAPFRSLGEPIFDTIGERPYVAQQSMLDATQPKGRNYYWKTEFVGELSEGFLAAFRDGGSGLTSPMSQGITFHLEGAVNEAPEDDGAVGNRDARYVTAFAASWPTDDGRDDEHVGWARNSWRAILPFSTGGNYVNFQVADDDEGRTAAAYGSNMERLRQIKSAYDPHNLFRVNRNVAPGA